jgi:hypothetical protein
VDVVRSCWRRRGGIVTYTGWARFEQQRRLLKPFGAGREVRHCAIAWPVCPCAHSGTLALWGMAGRTAKPGRHWCRPVGELSATDAAEAHAPTEPRASAC